MSLTFALKLCEDEDFVSFTLFLAFYSAWLFDSSASVEQLTPSAWREPLLIPHGVSACMHTCINSLTEPETTRGSRKKGALESAEGISVHLVVGT